MITEIWRDGILIETIETPDDPEELQASEPVVIPPIALETLKTDLNEATTIAKLKTALANFIENIEATL